MAQYNLGRVLPIFKRDWNPTVSYAKMDIVYYSGNSYVALAPNSGTVPTNTEYWQIIAARGVDGDAGAGADIKIVTNTNTYIDL